MPPTLRLYRWARPTVTLGRFQDAAGVDRDLCADEGIDVVRRFTGGRGVLHDDELTYSIVAGLDDGIPRGTCGVVPHAVRRHLPRRTALLGVDAALTARPRGDGSSAACYLHATPADLSLGAGEALGLGAGVARSTRCCSTARSRVSRDVGARGRVFRLSPSDAPCVSPTRPRRSPTSLGRRPSRRGASPMPRCDGYRARLRRARSSRANVTQMSERPRARLLGETSADALPARRRSVRASR